MNPTLGYVNPRKASSRNLACELQLTPLLEEARVAVPEHGAHEEGVGVGAVQRRRVERGPAGRRGQLLAVDLRKEGEGVT